jgi:hypothetical protein
VSPPERLVVCLAGDADRGLLPESKLVDDRFAYGGVRSCSALAFAAASRGWDVELRGGVPRVLFEELRAATDAVPRVGLPPRAPAATDVVLVPEGWRKPLEYGQVALSPARAWLYLLAPPGLFGWPFTEEKWSLPDPLTADPARLARPEHFLGMRALGFGLITHSHGIAAAAGRAGVACRYVGMGGPSRFPEPEGPRDTDVVGLVENRWAPLVEQVLSRLDGGPSVDRVPAVPNAEILRRFSRARVLLWPSRVEGHATIPIEARAMGCVPVALDSNPYVAGAGEEHGMVMVSSLEAMARAVPDLLGDPARLERLSAAGRDWAREHDDWDAFGDRVATWLAEVGDTPPGQGALAGVGAAVRAATAGLLEAREEIAVAERDLTAATLNQERLAAELEWMRGRKLVDWAHRFDRFVRRR